jgi:hypothetical protein
MLEETTFRLLLSRVDGGQMLAGAVSAPRVRYGTHKCALAYSFYCIYFGRPSSKV